MFSALAAVCTVDCAIEIVLITLHYITLHYIRPDVRDRQTDRSQIDARQTDVRHQTRIVRRLMPPPIRGGAMGIITTSEYINTWTGLADLIPRGTP